MRALLLLTLLALGCRGSTAPATTKPQEPAPVVAQPAALPVKAPPGGLLHNLFLIATGELAEPARIAAWQAKLDAKQATLDDYIDELVKHPGFVKTVSPRIMLRMVDQFVGNTQLMIKLKKTKVDGKIVYHLRKPCGLAEAVAVRPWWLETNATVLVCPDSYQPTHTQIPKTDWQCGGANASPFLSPGSTYCGCGKELVSCYPEELHGAGIKAMQDEVAQTIAYVVDKDLPLEQVFLQNETVRSGLGDHIYEVWDLTNKKRDTHRPPVKETRLAPRTEYFPGMHAGILTAPHVIWMPDAQRPRLNLYSYLMFCNPMKSSRVDTHVVLDLGAKDTRNGEGWQQLVKLPGCTNCHARLDHGVRFFTGWIDARKSFSFHPNMQVSEEGRLYMGSHDDLRAKAPTTPRAFAELAVQQPEFASCQAQNVLDYVVGADATANMRDAVLATAKPKLKMRDMMRVALREYASRYAAKPAALASVDLTAAQPGKHDVVEVTPALKAKLQEFCVDCHDNGQKELPSFEADRLPAKLLQNAATKVAFGAMPPDGFDPAQRAAFLGPAVANGWPASATETYGFLQEHMRSLMVHHPESLVLSLRARYGPDAVAQKTPNIPEIRLNQRQAQLTPSFAASMLLEQLKACKLSVKAKKHADTKSCMSELSIESTIRSPR